MTSPTVQRAATEADHAGFADEVGYATWIHVKLSLRKVRDA